MQIETENKKTNIGKIIIKSIKDTWKLVKKESAKEKERIRIETKA